jgi:hypothetical protein
MATTAASAAPRSDGAPSRSAAASVFGIDASAISSGASLLCAINCVVVPALTAAVPVLSSALSLLSGASASSSTTGAGSSLVGSVLGGTFLHSLTAYFVLPVGALATSLQLRDPAMRAPALLSGLGLLAVAAGHDLLPYQTLLAEATGMEWMAPPAGAEHAAESCCTDASVMGASGGEGDADALSPSSSSSGGGVGGGFDWTPKRVVNLLGPALMVTSTLWGRRIAAEQARKAAEEVAALAAAGKGSPAKACCGGGKKAKQG